MDFKLRPNASNGLWCAFLLPTCLLSTVCSDSGSQITSGIISLGLLVILFAKRFCFQSHDVCHRFYLLTATLCTAVINNWRPDDICPLFLTFYGTAWAFDWLYSSLLVNCPASFTLGEAAIVAQGATIFLGNTFLSLYNQFREPNSTEEHSSQSTKFSQILLLGCFVLMLSQYSLPRLRFTIAFYVSSIVVAVVLFASWTICLKQNPVSWLFIVCFESRTRSLLMLFWALSTAASILFVMCQNKLDSNSLRSESKEKKKEQSKENRKEQSEEKKKASTSSRKYFHAMITMVFLPGIIFDPELLRLASVVALAVFLILEMVRVLKIPPIGPSVNDAFQFFLDEKDSGVLILTHIYLLIGCACALWLRPQLTLAGSSSLSLMSGLISVGLGDTAAAVAGSAFGKHRWPGSKKTIEGTACAVAVQAIFVVLAMTFYCVLDGKNLALALAATISTSLLEARTTQVDNLVLPLFMFPFLCFVR